MKTTWIFVLTNQRGYNRVLPKGQKKESIIRLDDNEPILTGTFDSADYDTVRSTPNLYLVYDAWADFQNEILDKIDDQKSIIVVSHSAEPNSYSNLLKKYTSIQCIEGQHERNGIVYPFLFDIIDTSDDPECIYNKVLSIVSGNHSLENKLIFLHNCLIPGGVQQINAAEECLKIGLKEEELQELLRYENIQSEEYISALVALRDRILKE